MVANRVFNIKFKKKVLSLHLWFIMFFFNPFKKLDPNIIVPTFNFLPYIGVKLNRGANTVGICVGVFNFFIDIHIIYWMNKKDKDECE